VQPIDPQAQTAAMAIFSQTSPGTPLASGWLKVSRIEEQFHGGQLEVQRGFIPLTAEDDPEIIIRRTWASYEGSGQYVVRPTTPDKQLIKGAQFKVFDIEIQENEMRIPSNGTATVAQPAPAVKEENSEITERKKDLELIKLDKEKAKQEKELKKIKSGEDDDDTSNQTPWRRRPAGDDRFYSPYGQFARPQLPAKKDDEDDKIAEELRKNRHEVEDLKDYFKLQEAKREQEAKESAHKAELEALRREMAEARAPKTDPVLEALKVELAALKTVPKTDPALETLKVELANLRQQAETSAKLAHQVELEAIRKELLDAKTSTKTDPAMESLKAELVALRQQSENNARAEHKAELEAIRKELADAKTVTKVDPAVEALKLELVTLRQKTEHDSKVEELKSTLLKEISDLKAANAKNPEDSLTAILAKGMLENKQGDKFSELMLAQTRENADRREHDREREQAAREEVRNLVLQMGEKLAGQQGNKVGEFANIAQIATGLIESNLRTASGQVEQQMRMLESFKRAMNPEATEGRPWHEVLAGVFKDFITAHAEEKKADSAVKVSAIRAGANPDRMISGPAAPAQARPQAPRPQVPVQPTVPSESVAEPKNAAESRKMNRTAAGGVDMLSKFAASNPEAFGMVLSIIAEAIRNDTDPADVLDTIVGTIESFTPEGQDMPPFLDLAFTWIPLVPYKLVKKTVAGLAADDEDTKTLNSDEATTWWKKLQFAIKNPRPEEPEEDEEPEETELVEEKPVVAEQPVVAPVVDVAKPADAIANS
jgi:hypothetical protein